MVFGSAKQIQGFSFCRRCLLVMIAGTWMTVGLSGCIKPANPTPPTPVSGGTSQKPAAPAAGGNAAAPAAVSTATTTDGPVQGDTINIEGSSTVYLIAQAWAVEFEKMGNAKISLGRTGTGGGYKKFALRQCDLWNASRPIAKKEKDELADKHIEWLELEIAIDGISLAIHPKNDWCSEMTVADLRKVWMPESKVNKWSDLNPNWPDQTMDLFGADTDSGTFEYFTEVIVGKKGASRRNYQAASDDNVLIQGVSRSKFSLGYIPFGYCVENADKVKIIKISPTKEDDATPAPAVMPTKETILSGEYSPLSRPLFVYANRDALKRPEVVAYLKYVVSSQAQPLVSQRGFVQITEARRTEMVGKLQEALSESKTGSAESKEPESK